MRSIDQIVRDTIGNQAVEIIRLTRRIEELEEELAKRKKEEEE